MSSEKSSTSDSSGWAGTLVTVLLAMIAFTVQWGVITTKLDHVEKRLDELITETRTLRVTYQSLEHRVSYMEGRNNGKVTP